MCIGVLLLEGVDDDWFEVPKMTVKQKLKKKAHELPPHEPFRTIAVNVNAKGKNGERSMQQHDDEDGKCRSHGRIREAVEQTRVSRVRCVGFFWYCVRPSLLKHHQQAHDASSRVG